MAVWFTSDLHIQHRWCAKVRGFGDGESADEHDAVLAENWDRVVKPDDLVYIAGDLAMESNWRQALAWIGLRTGRKILIPGNHDPVHAAIHREGLRVQRTYLEVFEAVAESVRIKVTNPITGQPTRVLISHFPYRGSPFGDHYEGADAENRFEQNRLPNMGGWLLHGHTHSKDKQHGKSIHIGTDAWGYTPVSLEMIAARIGQWEPSLRKRVENYVFANGWEFYKATGAETRWQKGNHKLAIVRHLDEYPNELEWIVKELVEEYEARNGGRGVTSIPLLNLYRNQVLDDLGEFRS